MRPTLPRALEIHPMPVAMLALAALPLGIALICAARDRDFDGWGF
jgi:hypothetical protein